MSFRYSIIITDYFWNSVAGQFPVNIFNRRYACYKIF